MTSHVIGNLVTTVLAVVFIVSAIRRQLKGLGKAPVPARPGAAPSAATPALAGTVTRRRLAPAAAPRPITVPPSAAASLRAPINPSMAETLPAEAAAAFPGLDLSLGEGDVPGGPRPVRRRLRVIGGGPPLGSPGWGVNAVVAMEVLGPPVSLRPGATLGVPHAF